MAELNINSLQPDSYYTAPVFIDKEYILTTPDIPLSGNTIEKLKKWQFSSIITEGQLCSKPIVAAEEDGVQ